MAGRISMDVDDERLAAEAFLHISRQNLASLERIDSTLEGMRRDGQEMRERMIRIEMQDTRADLAKHETKITDLEKVIEIFQLDKARLQGNVGALGWLLTNWDRLVLVAGVLYMAAKSGHVLP